MVWPGTPGGAANEAWGESIRLYVQAGIGAGNQWHIGPHALDRLDAGNVIGPIGTTGTLWVDLSCDAVALDAVDGATKSAGIFSRDEAATLDLTLYDPARIYDPTNPASPYWLRGRSRLGAGTPIQVWAEVLNAAGTGVVRFDLFTGNVDTWKTSIERDAADRRARITATNSVKWMAAQDYAELAAGVGAGDTTAQRLARIRSYYNWAAPLEQIGTASTVTLQATTMAQSMWEHLGRTVDDELGYLYVLPNGTIRWWTRNFWTAPPTAPVVTLGCTEGVDAWDVITDTALGASDDQLRNAVYASRSGGTQQIVKSAASIAAHGGYESTVNRTDLGLADDGQVGTWANTIVLLYSFPPPGLDGLTMRPAIDGEPDGHRWRGILGTRYVTDVARVVWDEPDAGAPIDEQVRVLGAKHSITPDAWEITWQLLAARFGGASNVWHIGPHPLDRLDAGNVIGWAHTTVEAA